MDNDLRRPIVVADYIWNATLAFPILMAFIPGLWPLALRGFYALSQAPEWYRLAVDACITFAFGRKSVEVATQAYLAYRRSKQSSINSPPEATPGGN